ncbi:hypothetical protein B0H16DRAFT_374333 [Mycena metata]|uniref:Uncharacterized protein n=1 Tax=Mycena metata TaxID=1033252 RepID=A0AAD7NLJ0_9AGAR|nr:hypothetical protein B0H16DRAFT_374333 [Mycena metata]
MSDTPLRLDPGLTPRRLRKTSLCSCKCFCWTISIPLLGFAAWTSFLFATSLFREYASPHKPLYHTGAPYYNSEVIRPLISDEQTFDMAVTVWLRAPEEAEAEFRRLKLERAPPKEETPPAPVEMKLDGLGKVWASLSLAEGNTRFRDEEILETPLFSDVVFRGLRLSGKHALATVDFRLPTARFLAAKLDESDLRATFLLIPSAPSFNVKSFSSWMPDSVFRKRRPTRPWPFPLNSELRGGKTITDLALESFSISVPLLEFYDVASECKTADVNGTEEEQLPVVSAHPHVVTRTQLRIVRETALLNATAYNEVRNEIKKHSCGQGIPGIRPNLQMCRRTYKSNGIFETLLELEVPTESGVDTQWAYSPYMDTKYRAAGPLDIIPVPINRENCPSAVGSASDYMDVSWRIAFAGRSPLKLWVGDATPEPLVDHRATDVTKAIQQNEAELWNGALGHRFHEDSHPRRRIVMQAIGGAMQFVAAGMMFHFWWTRVSTVGISNSGVVLLALGNALGPTVMSLVDSDGSWIVVLPFSLVAPFLMFKCIARIEFGWNKWHPTLTRVPASHQERTTQRMDQRTSWRAKLGVVVALIAVHYLLDPDSIYLVPSSILVPPPKNNKLLKFLQVVSDSLCATGTFSQVLLNNHMRAFGGFYRAEPVLYFTSFCIDLVYHFLPTVVGRISPRSGLTLTPMIAMGMQLPLIWQAFTLPPVKVNEEED